MAALTLPGSLLARLFHAKVSAEGPAVGTQPSAAGKSDAAFPALLEGLVGEHMAGQERNSGGHTRGKFTELERLIARTGRVQPPDKAATDTDLVTVQSVDGKPAVPEVRRTVPRLLSLVVPEPQIAEASAPAEQSASLPELRIAVETKVEAPKIQLTAQAIAKVEATPLVVRAAAKPGVAISEKAQPRTAATRDLAGQALRAAAPKLTATAAAPPRGSSKDASPAGHRRATGTAVTDHPSVDTTDAASEATTKENALPEPANVVASPPPALHTPAEQPAIEWAPKANRLATPRPAANEVARAARQSTVTNPERHEQTSAAGSKPAPTPTAELRMPVPAVPAVVPEKAQPAANPLPGAAPDVPSARSLAPSVLAADAKPAELSASEELPAAGHFDGWLNPPVSTGAAAANPPADRVASLSPRNTDTQAPGGAKVRTLSIASPDRGEVAFELELRPAGQPPMTTEHAMPHAVAPSGKAIAPETVAIEAVAGRTAQAPREDTARVAEAPAPSGDTDRPATGERDRKQATPERSAKPAAPVDSHPESAAALPGVKVSNWAPSGVARPEGLAEPASPPDASPARPDESAAARMDAKPEVHAASAHEIKLEVSGGERRVEVRLSERGGEIRVAVRTPDSHLAGTLRESLPELTTRFAESGLRSEIWRPGGSLAGESRHAPEAAPGNLAQDTESQSRGNGGEQQGDAQERQQRSSQEPKNDKEKGKDFAWLMSSLR